MCMHIWSALQTDNHHHGISIIIKCYTTDDKTSQTNDQDLQVHSQVHYACFVCVNLYNLVISITNFSLNTVSVSARHVPCLL